MSFLQAILMPSHGSARCHIGTSYCFQMEQFFPNLPDEIGLECLLRVSYKSHKNLKGVCRSWRLLVENPWFYQQRKTRGTSDHFLFMIQALHSSNHYPKQITPAAYGITVYEPLQGTWDRLPPIPQFPESVPLFSQCVSARGKFILMGGWHPSTWGAMNTVFVYDLLSGEWNRGANMPTVRSFFGCCVSPQGIVYVVGGHDEDKIAVPAAEAYDVEKDRWDTLPAMDRGRDECQAVFIDAKLVVISGYATETQGRFEKGADVYDPYTRTWKVMENMWRSGESPRSCVAALGGLYCLGKKGVIKYKAEENVWTQAASMPATGSRVYTCAAACGDKIFVSCGGDEMQCYVFEPANGKWAAVDIPQGFLGFVEYATSLEI